MPARPVDRKVRQLALPPHGSPRRLRVPFDVELGPRAEVEMLSVYVQRQRGRGRIVCDAVDRTHWHRKNFSDTDGPLTDALELCIAFPSTVIETPPENVSF